MITSTHAESILIFGSSTVLPRVTGIDDYNIKIYCLLGQYPF
jgi:hypothetical protein